MHHVDTGDHLFGVSVNAFNYMRNTEYFNKIEVGRTLFGYQFNPSIYYQPHSAVKISAGVFLRNDFGGKGFNAILPTFTIKTEQTDMCGGSFSMIAGTLEGAASHRMLEPMLDVASAIERRIENGFEVKLETKTVTKSFFDLWINWEKFIERGSPYKELFTAGTNLQPSFKFITPVFQGMLTHRGGQIDSDTLNPLTMQFNTAVGLRSAQIRISDRQSLVAEAYYMGYKETSSSGQWPFKSGEGVYVNASYKISGFELFNKGITFMLSYWNAKSYIAPRGTAIYQSQSIDNPTYFEKKRELLFVRFLYDRPLFNQLYMSARAEPFYDLRNKILDYSFSFYLSYKTDINFKRK